jgi:hypothetical protein
VRGAPGNRRPYRDSFAEVIGNNSLEQPRTNACGFAKPLLHPHGLIARKSDRGAIFLVQRSFCRLTALALGLAAVLWSEP